MSRALGVPVMFARAGPPSVRDATERGASESGTSERGASERGAIDPEVIA